GGEQFVEEDLSADVPSAGEVRLDGEEPCLLAVAHRLVVFGDVALHRLDPDQRRYGGREDVWADLHVLVGRLEGVEVRDEPRADRGEAAHTSGSWRVYSCRSV